MATAQAKDTKDQRIAELEEELALVRASAAAPAGDHGAILERLTAVMEQLAEARQPAAPAGPGSFGAGETADAILRSLQGSVSVGEHSGRYTSDGGSDPELAVPITFRSKGVNFNVVRKSRTRLVHVDGTPEITPGVHYSFAPAGIFQTDDMAVVEYLRSRPTYNVEFWEVGNEPNRPKDPGPVLEAILKATAALDDAALAEIQKAEREGDNRDEILRAVTSARKTIRGLQESEA